MSSRGSRAEPFFLSAESGRLFALWHTPDDRPYRALLHVPAFGEEMNKSRRMVALLAQSLRARGTATLLVDLHGSGDSEGNLEDVTLATWQQDLRCALDWLRTQGVTEIVLWGHRLGAVLAANLAAQNNDIQRMLLWNPVTTGNRFVTQFLRLRTASSLMRGEQETVKQLREKLHTDGTLEVAGCVLPHALVDSLDQLKLADLLPTSVHATAWFDVNPEPGASIGAGAGKIVAQWRAAGHEIHAEVLQGERFWSTQEIALAPALLDASVAFVENTHPHSSPAEQDHGKSAADVH